MNNKYLGYFISSCALALFNYNITVNALGEETLDNFTQKNYFSYGQFVDVPDEAWYTEKIAQVYEFGLMSGTSGNLFEPSGEITIAQTLVLAFQLNSTYRGLDESALTSIDAAQEPWYQPYVTYALENNIISRGYSNYYEPITRAEFVHILYSSLPYEVFTIKNVIYQNDIPDVTIDSTYATAIYTFYRAGILAGNDVYGTFSPDSSIQRSEVATILINLINPNERADISLEPIPVLPTELYIQPNNSNLLVGDYSSMTIYFIPDNTTQTDIIWSSTNESVASIVDGKIQANGVGTATITGRTTNGLESSCVLTVSKRDSIRILSVKAYPNSVGGVGPTIHFRNDSGQTIKYITFVATPLNGVGDVVADSITKKTTVDLRRTGPIEPLEMNTIPRFGYFYYNGMSNLVSNDRDGNYYVSWWSSELSRFKYYYLTEYDYNNVFNELAIWDPVWYNGSIKTLDISKVIIEYMDGKIETIYNPTIWSEYL